MAPLGRSALLAAGLVGWAVLSCGDRQPTSEAPSTSAADETRTPEDPWFEECARERGLDFVHRSGHDGETFLFPEILGGGVALVDLDGDGDLDAYLVQSGTLRDGDRGQNANALFANGGDGRFVDATAASGADDRGYGMGVAAGDADGDGRIDLYVTNLEANALLLAEASADTPRFSDVTDDAGVGDPSWSVSAAFFDAENDGDLDLFVANYVRWSIADELLCEQPAYGPDYCSPKAYRAPAPDTFYRNDGTGVFVDESTASGMRGTFGNGLGVVCADFDQDGFVDVFVANDGTMNQLWVNRGDGTFFDDSVGRGCAADEHGLAKAGMGVAAADLDDDGDEDLLVVNLGRESDSLYRNEGRYFEDDTAVVGLAVVSRAYTRFGVGLEDFDNDGWLDLFQANGRVARLEEPEGDDPYAEPNLLLRGGADGRFSVASPPGGTAEDLVATSRGAAFGDVDGDGGIDVLVVNRDAPAHLYRNLVSQRGHVVRLRACERRGVDAVGAIVRGRLGERRISRTVRSGTSYAAACDPTVSIGLGSAGAFEEVVVRWPDGEQESFGSFEAGIDAVLLRGSGERP